MTRRVKDPLLEQYLAGAMPEAAKLTLEKTLAESPADQARLEELRADGAAYLVKHPPTAFAQKVVSTSKKRLIPPWLWVVGLTTASAAVALLVARAPVDDGGDTVKGGVTFSAYRQTPAGLELITGPVHAGEVLQFSVVTPTPGYVVLLGAGDDGGVRAFVPAQGVTALSVSAGKTVLPGAVQLDDGAAAAETFTLVWSPDPISVGDALSRSEVPGRARREVRLTKQ